MNRRLAFLAALLLALPAQAEEYGQIHDAIRYCQPKTEDMVLMISSCLKAIDSNLLDRDALAEAWTNVGAAHLALKQYDDAVPALTHAIEADPKKWQAYVDRAVAEAELRKAEQSEADLDTAIQIAPPETPSPVRMRGQLYLGEGRLDLAIADFTAALEKDPNDPRIYGLRAIAYTKQGKADLAAADRAQYSKLDPDDKYGLLKRIPPSP